MANIITYDDFNAYGFGTADLSLTGYAVSDIEMDFTGASEVSGFTVQQTIPEGAATYWAFNDGSAWFSLSIQGYAQAFGMTIGSAEDIIQNGNTAAELTTLTAIPAFIGKTIKVAIAFSANDESSVPTVQGFSVKFKAKESKTQLETFSPEYSLGANAMIVSAAASSSTEGTGKAEITGRYTLSNGTVSEWVPLDELALQEATSVQFKALLSVTTPNTGTVLLNGIETVYTDLTAGGISGGDKELITNTENWYIAIRQGRLMLKHEPLDEGSTITPYLALRKLPESVDSWNLGTGTGEKVQYELPQKTGIDIHSIKLFIDGSRVYTGYEVNTATGKLTCTAPSGAMITVSYEYGIEAEEWQEMQEVSSWEMPEYTQTEYRYAVPEDEESKGICAVKIVLHSASGSSASEAIGTGTGYLKTYQLAHAPKDSKVTVYANGSAVSAKYIGNRLVQVNAVNGRKLTAKYDWTSEPPVITQITAVFSE